MRNQFARSLEVLMAENNNLLMFYADIGNRLFNTLKGIAGERVINAGIAEANMASMAAGAAKMNMPSFIYTITPFTSARNFEQIKVDIAYQNLPVNIVGTGSGLGYANLGPTHHSFEDIALMRVLPNMVVLAPCDAYEFAALMPQVAKDKRPCYLRIGKKNEPEVYQKQPELEIGVASVLEQGEKIAILAAGTIMPEAQKLRALLKDKGIDAELVSFHTIKPLDEQYLTAAMAKFDHLVTIEEHSIHGGFGSAILEWINDNGFAQPVKRFAIPDKFIDQVGSVDDARKAAGLTAEQMLSELERGTLCASV